MDRPEDIAEPLWALVKPFRRRPLLEADRALDDARRLVFYKAYSGLSDRRAIKAVRPIPEAKDMAALTAGGTVEEAVRLIERVRTIVWCLHFREDKSSAYARLYEADRKGQAHQHRPGHA